MSKIADKESFLKELRSLEELYEETTGKEMPRFYRPPQGKYSESNLKMAQELGYKTVFWSLAYVDWYTDNQPTHQEAFNKLLPHIRERLYCCTAPQKPIRKFLTNFLQGGSRKGIHSKPSMLWLRIKTLYRVMYERCDFVDWNICDCPEIFGDIHAVIITYAAFASTFRDAVESAGYVFRRRTICVISLTKLLFAEDDG